ncbi:MAG: phosphodiesterase [Pseudomonadota bacterium]|nr:phosphodiesterase [Pseudomonadota bacterium]
MKGTRQNILIAQITDTHVGFEPEAGDEEFNYLRFRMAIDHLLEQPVKPDLLLLTGDLADNGAPESYERFKKALTKCDFPFHVMTGNHDHRDRLLEAFPDCPTADGFVQYAIELDGLRLLCLDTLQHGRHGGAFCETRAAWLSAQLRAHQDTPTFIIMHHPPVVAGIDWMDPRPGEGWLQRFEAAVSGHSQIVGIACGHLHRPVATVFGDIPVSITPAVAPAVSLDLRPVDFGKADGRGIVDAEPPGYSLHRWSNGKMVTHFQPVGDWTRLATYSENLIPMMQGLDAERK